MRPFAHPTGHVESMSDWITARRFHESEGVEDWRVVGEGACAHFRTGSFAAGARLVKAISELATLDDHHPDVDLRHDGVIVRLITVAPDYYGLSERDLELARKISSIARKLGVPADPATVQTVLVTIDAFDIPKVKPFWRAVLAYQDREDSPEDLVDPRGRGAAIWSRRSKRQTPRSTGSTSTSGCPPTKPRHGSPPRSRQAAVSSPTRMRPPGGRCPIPRATSLTSQRRRAATEQALGGLAYHTHIWGLRHRTGRVSFRVAKKARRASLRDYPEHAGFMRSNWSEGPAQTACLPTRDTRGPATSRGPARFRPATQALDPSHRIRLGGFRNRGPPVRGILAHARPDARNPRCDRHQGRLPREPACRLRDRPVVLRHERPRRVVRISRRCCPRSLGCGSCYRPARQHPRRLLRGRSGGRNSEPAGRPVHSARRWSTGIGASRRPRLVSRHRSRFRGSRARDLLRARDVRTHAREADRGIVDQ